MRMRKMIMIDGDNGNSDADTEDVSDRGHCYL